MLRFRFSSASFSSFGCFFFEIWVLRFRVLGAPFSSLGCSVFESWVLRFRDLGASFSRFGCFVLRSSFSSVSFSKLPLNHCLPSAKFTMEIERNASLPFIGFELLNLAPRIKTKVYVKPTNTGLLLHYQSHVDNRYKRSLITTMLDRAYRISSDWSYFSQECDRLETVLKKLKN